MLQPLGLELRKSHLPRAEETERGHRRSTQGSWETSTREPRGRDLNSRSNARLLNQEGRMVPKPRASEGRERGAEPRAPNRTSAGMGCGDRKYAPGLCPLLLPPPACASRATLSRKPCPGGHHLGADSTTHSDRRAMRPELRFSRATDKGDATPYAGLVALPLPGCHGTTPGRGCPHCTGKLGLL